MRSPGPKQLLVLSARRALGISLFLYAFYIVAFIVWDMPPLTVRDVLAILGVVYMGVWLGIGFSTVWPHPNEPGFQRILRTALLTVPAMGFGIAIYIFLEGAEGQRAYYIMFALGAWLGSHFIREDEEDSEEPSEAPTGPEPTE